MKFLTCLLILCGFTLPALADLYSIRDIKVSAEAENAVVARDMALQEAPQKAFPRLMDRLVLSVDPAGVHANPAEIAALVQGLEISNEKNTATKYMADVSVQFKKEAVTQFLTGKGLTFVTKTPPTFVIIPVYQEGSNVHIFEDENPLFTSLKKNTPASSVYQLTVPWGDLDDVMAATPALLKEGDSGTLNKIISRYKTDYALIIQVTKNGTIYTVKTMPYPENSAAGADMAFAVSSSSSNIPGIMNEVMKKTIARLEQKFKQNQTLRTDMKGEMTLVLPINGLSEWTLMEKKLKGLSFLDTVSMQALYRHQVFVKIGFSDTVPTILEKLSQAGFDLTAQPDGTWLGRKSDRSSAPTSSETFYEN